MKKLSVVLLATLGLSACSTLTTLDMPQFYSGVQADFDTIDSCSSGSGIASSGNMGCVLMVPYSYIDLPFSFVVDTVLLPVKAVHKLVAD